MTCIADRFLCCFDCTAESWYYQVSVWEKKTSQSILGSIRAVIVLDDSDSEMQPSLSSVITPPAEGDKKQTEDTMICESNEASEHRVQEQESGPYLPVVQLFAAKHVDRILTFFRIRSQMQKCCY